MSDTEPLAHAHPRFAAVRTAAAVAVAIGSEAEAARAGGTPLNLRERSA